MCIDTLRLHRKTNTWLHHTTSEKDRNKSNFGRQDVDMKEGQRLRCSSVIGITLKLEVNLEKEI